MKKNLFNSLVLICFCFTSYGQLIINTNTTWTANQITGKKNIIFSVVRYGNVLGSRGSILPKLLNENKYSNFLLLLLAKQMVPEDKMRILEKGYNKLN